jgi:hypothetical protein
LTNHLFVEAFAGQSGHTAERDQQRLAHGPSLGDTFGVIVINPMEGDIGVFETSL